eukprot:s3829_g3.t1
MNQNLMAWEMFGDSFPTLWFRFAEEHHRRADADGKRPPELDAVREHRRREETLRSDEEIIRWRLEDIGSQLKAKLREQQEANSDLAALEEDTSLM